MWDWLSGILGEGPNALLSLWEAVWSVFLALVAVAQYLFALLVKIFNFFYNLALTIGKFFKTLWQDFFKNIFTPIWNTIKTVHQWLENLLRPIIHFLQTINKWVQWFFNAYIKPVLKVLNIVRGFLNVLKAFGVKWAAQLDHILGVVVADITSAFRKVTGYINAVIGIVNSLADPLGLFRGPTFAMSMRRIFPSFMRGVSGLPLGYFFPSPRAGAPLGMGGTPLPFNPGNPSQNPPPSTYFGYDDGLGSFGGWDGVDPLQDTDADFMSPLDYFDDSAYPPPNNPDPVSAANDVFDAIFSAQLVSS
jgi:hypothetical protein